MAVQDEVTQETLTHARTPRVSTYFAVLAVTLVACLGTFILALLVLHRTGNLPPPPIVNNLCLDEKLLWMRNHPPPQDTDLAIFGSSVAWRQFDSQEAINQGMARHPYNFALCGLSITQSTFLADNFLKHVKNVKSMLFIVGPDDFHRCGPSSLQSFHMHTIDKFVFGHARIAPLYLRFTDLGSLIRNASLIKRERTGQIKFDPFILDRYGDSLVDVTGNRGLMYREVNLENACFNAFASFARHHTLPNASLFVVLIPMSPAWTAKYDPDRAVLKETRRRLKQSFEGTPAVFLDLSANSLFTEKNYFDAVHLNAKGARKLTGDIAEQLRPLMADGG